METIKLSKIFLIITFLITISFTSIAGENTSFTSTIPLINFEFKYCSSNLWKYLRLGLNYLESPNPLKPPEETSPKYLHPDKCGFGAYGFTPEAYEDVQRLYPFFRNICWQQILESSQLYELANQAYADWLLGQLKFYLKEGASWQEIFDLLHQVWNVGLSGFKNGKIPVSSRFKRAEEFKKMFYL